MPAVDGPDVLGWEACDLRPGANERTAGGDWGLEKAAINENEQKGRRGGGREDRMRRARAKRG